MLMDVLIGLGIVSIGFLSIVGLVTLVVIGVNCLTADDPEWEQPPPRDPEDFDKT